MFLVALGVEPHLRRWNVLADIRRFIPARSGQDLEAGFALLHEEGSPATPSRKKPTPHGELHFQKSTLPTIPYLMTSVDHC